MPYTPPSQQNSPASTTLTSPISLGHQRSSSSSATYFHPQPSPPRSPGPRPNLPRSSSSASYMQRSRRAPSHLGHSSLDHVTEAESSQDKDLSINTSIRQSPPPVADGASPMPAQAIVSPPDSAQNSSDDEEHIRGQPVTSLQQLHDVVRRLEVNRKSPPAAEHTTSSSEQTDDRPVTPPGHLSATARKISHSRSSSENPIYSPPPMSNVTSQYASDEEDEEELTSKPPLIRKKSGELVKPAIRPKVRRKPSSMPGTPTFSKAVHFNEDIEQVRHFLHSERPIAVSAGTSPVEVFEDETEFPWTQSTSKGGDISIRLPNFPRDTHERQTAPVRLERIVLAADKKHLIGAVAVANLAFNKLVCARFTFDHWRTTSEVVAEFNRDTRQPTRTDGYDQFNFSIKLSDQGNIDAKTMFICVRYNVNGQDYWDNNADGNYQVEFDVTQAAPASKPVSTSGSSRGIPRSRHNSPASRRPRSVPSFDDDFSSGYDGNRSLAFQFRNPNAAPKPSVELPDTPPTLKRPAVTGNQFGSRYDFGASLSAALTHAQSSMGDRSGIKPRADPMLRTPGLSAPGLTEGAESPRPDTLLATNKSLDSRAYQEFVSKFCFFGSAPVKGASPAGGSPAGGSNDVTPTNEKSGKVASRSATGTDGASDDAPRMTAQDAMKAHPVHIEQAQRPSIAPEPLASPSIRSRSTSPATGRNMGMSASNMFGYPYNVNNHGSYFSGSTTPPAIRG
ncbi:hypothetical protein FH972_026119 [Carpinus fangiana]|uniref:CBM21 domain-containing protein n=1 Tax=Carpinus fangiana TaxID=176857 RepID=A0A5N6L376_9ROSI|nr:hypothetical protein FH972_026119 [Carpinus fangiana]